MNGFSTSIAHGLQVSIGSLCLAGLSFATLRTLAMEEELLSFDELAASFFEKHGVGSVEELPMEKLLAEHCIRFRLGAIELFYPLAFVGEKAHTDELPRLSAAMLEMQRHWVAWVASDATVVGESADDFETLAKWIKGLKGSKIAKAADKGGRDVAEMLEPKEKVTAALEALNGLLCSSDQLKIVPKDGSPQRILFAPTRRAFVEGLAYMGLLDPTQKKAHWQPIATEWTTFWIDQDLVMALQYPAWEPSPDFEKGLDMNKFDKNGLEQHAVQQAANALQWACFGNAGSPFFHQAVAMNLAISVCGELNALEGDGWGYGTTGARTQPYERFVPGGNSSGGVLPPMPAAPLNGLKEGRWRENHGSDYFLACLKNGQRDGGQELGRARPEHLSEAVRKDKRAHFLIFGTNDSDRYVISAPFFGAGAKKKPYPPADMLIDYREFFRAYKSCFMNWLQFHGADGDEEESLQTFGQLMRAKYEDGGERSLEELVEEVYGMPLSADDGTVESLEWRFLDWLARGR